MAVVRFTQLFPNLPKPVTLVFVFSENEARLKIIQNEKLVFLPQLDA